MLAYLVKGLFTLVFTHYVRDSNPIIAGHPSGFSLSAALSAFRHVEHNET